MYALFIDDPKLGMFFCKYFKSAVFSSTDSVILPKSLKPLFIMSEMCFILLLFHSLSYNQIGNEGAKYLSKANFLYLKTLELSDNVIGKEGEEEDIDIDKEHE